MPVLQRRGMLHKVSGITYIILHGPELHWDHTTEINGARQNSYQHFTNLYYGDNQLSNNLISDDSGYNL